MRFEKSQLLYCPGPRLTVERLLVSGFGLQVLASEHPEDPCLSSFFCCCFIDYLPKVLAVGVGDWYT